MAQVSVGSPPVDETPPAQRLLSFSDGDIVLHTSDEVDFQVHKLILREASPFFRDMFNLPLPQKAAQPEKIPTIQVDEDSRAINNLLKLVYPTDDAPDLSPIEDVITLLQVCEKYQVKCVFNAIFSCAIAARLSTEPPVRAWAIATRYNLEHARREAIIRFIKGDNNNFFDAAPDELRDVNGRQSFDLIGIREKAIAIARQEIAKMGWRCSSCPSTGAYPGMLWKAGYIERTSKVNPFSYDATSESTIEACVATLGCSSCRYYASQPDPRVIRNALRARLENILCTAYLGRQHIK